MKKFNHEGHKGEDERIDFSSSLRVHGPTKIDLTRAAKKAILFPMETYDAVAELYSSTFDHIGLRQFEWPWLLKLIWELKPLSILDLGCGNGYLAKALSTLVPWLAAAEPCEPLFLSARERLGKNAELYQAPAENLPFNDGEFDMVVSLLSFRYMQWDKALGEIHRVLKPGGSFILIDLFASRFNPLCLPNYIETWAVTHLQHLKNKTYRKKLLRLCKNREWLKMTAEHPKRELADAKARIREKFFIKKEKLLSAALGGKTVGLVCGAGGIDSLRGVHTQEPAPRGSLGAFKRVCTPSQTTLREQHTPSACGGVVDCVKR